MSPPDDFLKKLRTPPRREFAERLYQSIDEGRRIAPTYPIVRRLALSVAVGILMFAVALFVSSGVRARGMELLRIIGGVRILEIDDRIEAEPEHPEETLTPIASERITLEQAQSILAFKMPTWLPEGFAAPDLYEPLVTWTRYALDNGEEMEMLHLRWENLNGRLPAFVDLRVDNHSEGGLLVGQGNGAEEVKINGQPAALVYGAWHVDTGRYEGPEITLLWIDEGLKYTLLTSRDQGVTVDDLMRIAASMH